MSYCRKDRKEKKKKKEKKRKYPLKLYLVEYEYTGYGSKYVKAESEGHARQIAEDHSEEPFDTVDITETNEDDPAFDSESVLNENGNYT